MGNISGWTLMVAALGLAACSGDDGKGSPAAGGSGNTGGSGGNGSQTTGAFDACALVPIADIQSIVAETIVEAEREDDGDGLRCNWRDADTFGVLGVLSHDTLALYEFSKGAASARPITGVGDEAHVSIANTVYVRVGERSFFAQGLSTAGDGQISPEIERVTKADDDEDDVLQNEAAYRLAKVVAAKLR